MPRGVRVLVLILLFVIAARGNTSDWPTYRYDAARRGFTQATLPSGLQRLWVSQLPKPEPAWPKSQHLLQFDGGPNIVAVAGRVFVPSSRTDSLTALDIHTGAQLWTFYADGPVRLAPVATADSVYFVSDDGHLYCLVAASGDVRWKVTARLDVAPYPVRLQVDRMLHVVAVVTSRDFGRSVGS